MSKAKDEMITIAEASRRSGIPKITIRYWARTKQLSESELRQTDLGDVWYVTLTAVQERDAKRGTGGRPRKK